jgi:DNA polymerase I - 3''-5'' exonuclease and polymerase domains
MTKKAMVDLNREGFTPMIQIHDEVALSVSGPQDAVRASRIMEQAIPLEIPSKCDIEVGNCWGELEDVVD